MGYARSPFRDFENSPRIVVGLDEDDIQLILKQYSSNFVTYELSRGFTQLKILQKLFTLWVIISKPYKFNLMIIP